MIGNATCSLIERSGDPVVRSKPEEAAEGSTAPAGGAMSKPLARLL